MAQSKVSNRYAKALLNLAIEQKSLDACYNDMVLLNSSCVENKDLALMLKSPIVNTDKKNEILNQIFKAKFSKISMAFIAIITNKKREGLLADIASSFISLYKSFNNITTASVVTAQPIDADLKKEFINFIKSGENKEVELNEIVDETIIGGAIIRMGDKQIDTSVIRTIKELKKTYNKNLYIKDF